MRTRMATAILACLTATCGDFAGSNITSQKEEISTCGGFPKSRTPVAERGYCDAEVLTWSYSPGTGKLELVDSRVPLNCCGVHRFELSQADGTLVATETDLPDYERWGESGRCRCMCVFDFRLTAEAIPAGVVPFRLERAIFEESESRVIYEGELDLSVGAGEIVLDDQPIDSGLCTKTDPT